jgi:hypothetical protein
MASDLVRDGMALELVEASGKPVAEVFCCEATAEMTFSACRRDLPLAAIDWLVVRAKVRLPPAPGVDERKAAALQVPDNRRATARRMADLPCSCKVFARRERSGCADAAGRVRRTVRHRLQMLKLKARPEQHGLLAIDGHRGQSGLTALRQRLRASPDRVYPPSRPETRALRPARAAQM